MTRMSRTRDAVSLGLTIGIVCLFTAGSVQAQQTWTFTTCGETGRTGPDQSMCDTAYGATSLDGAVTVTGGIQAWTVPVSGTYRIEAWGAAGGTQIFDTGFAGGRGAYIAGDFDLAGGETIYVIVGQMGGDTREDAGSGGDIDNAGPGGGGGSFVYRDATDPFPLVAAGGGGAGGRCSSVAASLRDGSAGEDGNRGGSVDNGGLDGNGGTSNAGGSSYWAGGGAGWLTDGTGGNNLTDYYYPLDPNDAGGGDAETGEGGRAPRNGAIGGLRWDDGLDEGGDGGFGGGGGGGSDNMGGGGGGGFSGGGGSRYDPCENEPGGGGGSYNGGINATNTAGVNTGAGSVVITTAATQVPTLSEFGLLIMTLLLAAAGFVAAKLA